MDQALQRHKLSNKRQNGKVDSSIKKKIAFGENSEIRNIEEDEDEMSVEEESDDDYIESKKFPSSRSRRLDNS
jgi:hypothetical protein